MAIHASQPINKRVGIIKPSRLCLSRQNDFIEMPTEMFARFASCVSVFWYFSAMNFRRNSDINLALKPFDIIIFRKAFSKYQSAATDREMRTDGEMI